MNDPISKWMTRAPYTISDDATLEQARARMEAHGIRHLPVLHGGALVGLISDRDLKMFSDVRDLDQAQIGVSEAMSPDVLAVGPDVKVRAVAAKMLARKCGSAVVMEGKKVAGIFTTVDALALICDLGSGEAASAKAKAKAKAKKSGTRRATRAVA